ncbi:MAG: holin family protein [Oscillospiraceae bacterium]
MNIKTIYYGGLSILAAIGAWIAAALGGWNAALQTMCIVMAVDYFTGIICALFFKSSTKSESGSFNSKASLIGLLKKGAMLFVVLLAYNLDNLAGTLFLREAVIFFFIGNDGLSIVENLGLMGVPLPSVIKNAFEVLKQKGDNGKDNTGDT